MSLPIAFKWKEAIDRELFQLQRLKVVEVVLIPANAHLLSTKWSYKVKHNNIYKACFCIQGDKQEPSIDFEDIFIVVVCLETFCIIMTMVTIFDFKAHC